MASDQISVLFVCLGNICRSTMAEGIFRSIVSKPPYKDLISTVDSCGTGAYHTGSSPDSRTMSTLEDNGIDDYDHAARKVLPYYLPMHEMGIMKRLYTNLRMICYRFTHRTFKSSITSSQWIEITSEIFKESINELEAMQRLCYLGSMQGRSARRRSMILTMEREMALRLRMSSA